MLFDAKLDAIRHHLAYVRHALETCLVDAHPNLAQRLRLHLDAVARLERDTNAVASLYSSYRRAGSPARDIWRQLVAKLRTIDGRLHILRTEQLPAYLVASQHDRTYSTTFEAFYREVGVMDVHPVVSLRQPGWFAVWPDHLNYPLFLAPASVLTDPGELSLVFHEMGHIFYRFSDLQQRTERVLRDALNRKAREIRSMQDPTVRRMHRDALDEWRPLAEGQLQELVCDVTGTLLGGPAFTVALAVGLLLTDPAPFDYSQELYPPLDCRMRVGGIVLRRLGLDGPTLDAVEDGWGRVSALYVSSQPPLYPWLYDDAYLTDLASEVEVFLMAEGAQPYRPRCGGWRERMVGGADLRLSDLRAHRLWMRAFSDDLLRAYSS